MRKTLTKRSNRKNRRKSSITKMKKGTLAIHLQQGLSHQIQSSSSTSAASSRFHNLLDSELVDPQLHTDDVDERDFILSQDFFCTPDYITPDNQNLLNGFDSNKENIPCPKSPEKINTVKTKKLLPGTRGKAKPKFAFRFQSHKDGPSQPCISIDKNAVLFKVHDVHKKFETFEHIIVGNSSPPLHEDFCGENVNLSEIEPAEVADLGVGFVDHSMSGLLDVIQDKNILPSGNSKMCGRMKSKWGQLVMKRSVSSLGDRIINDEDQPELLAIGSSSDDETNHQNLSLANLEVKKQTMADRFQEALDATLLSNEEVCVTAAKSSGVRLFGKLQKVIQSEKERDNEFLKRIKMGASPNGESCTVVVKILSRYFDAKLTVCSCTFGEHMEASQSRESSKTDAVRGRTRTVIFSPRFCGDVDLDVGNLICIYPPWKEVQVIGNDEFIMLTTFFSQIFV